MSLEIVQRVRSRYPTPLGVTHGRFLLEVAGELGLGLVRKSWGTFVTLPDGTGVSQDCVMATSGWHWDILVDGENKALPAWELVEEEGHPGQPLILPLDRLYPVTATPQPGPDPQPPQPPPDNSDAIAKLQEQVAMLARSIAAVNETANDAQAAAEAAQSMAIRGDAEVKEWVRGAKVKGRTQTNSWHSHQIDLGLEWS